MVFEFFLVFTSRLEYSKLGRIYDNSNQICHYVGYAKSGSQKKPLFGSRCCQILQRDLIVANKCSKTSDIHRNEGNDVVLGRLVTWSKVMVDRCVCTQIYFNIIHSEFPQPWQTLHCIVESSLVLWKGWVEGVLRCSGIRYWTWVQPFKDVTWYSSSTNHGTCYFPLNQPIRELVLLMSKTDGKPFLLKISGCPPG